MPEPGLRGLVRRAAAVINRYPDRFLFGTDEVAPADQDTYLRVYRQYDPLWKLLTPEAREKVRKGNYLRLFDAARVEVRAWEKANPPVARGGDGMPASGLPTSQQAAPR